MIREHKVFDLDLGDQDSIWRYMDFPKFAAMIIDSSVHFSRFSILDDKFEGRFPTHNPRQNVSEFAANLFRHGSYLSSWFIGEHESNAMWKVFCSSHNSICVRSSIGRLRSVLNNLQEDVYLGRVKYIDFDKDNIPSDNLLSPFVRKGKFFAYENECRIVITKMELVRELLVKFNENINENSDDSLALLHDFRQQIPSFIGPDDEVNLKRLRKYKAIHDNFSDDFLAKNMPAGIDLTVDVKVLLEKIYVSPFADAWFTEVVRKFLNAVGRSEIIVKNSLMM